ncbi:MAG: group III truncated hemoglobin [Pseudarcicella sp.]|nr:group III truncated hemoglobin [Pseudarcicella sp.]MBP6409945.1 group III truncated hemoglobin [Pseudarcicella sp.]
MKKNLETSEDIKMFVDAFYEKIQCDDLLSTVFNDVAQVNWNEHLPRMYSFWEMLLLEKSGYAGQPFRPHLIVNQNHRLTPLYFDRWLKLFNETIDTFFEGDKADEAKFKAKNIALTWAHKLDYINKLED